MFEVKVIGIINFTADKHTSIIYNTDAAKDKTMIKLIAIDLDGTLINHRGDITERTLEVLEEAHQQQICLVLCTGCSEVA